MEVRRVEGEPSVSMLDKYGMLTDVVSADAMYSTYESFFVTGRAC